MTSRPAFARLALGAAATAYLALFLGLALLRIAYPFELEWQEGGVLDHVQRVTAGEPLYARPALDFIAFPYPPLFYWIGAATTRVIGEGFLALRLVSLVSSLACFALLFHLGRRRAGDALAGLLSVGLFAATYRFSGAWLDIARVDSLSLALLLGAYAVLESRDPRSLQAGVIAGILLFLAVLAKQTALIAALPLIVSAIMRGRGQGTAAALGLLLPLAASTWWLDATSDGWYRWYVFDMLAGHPWIRERIPGFLLEIGANLGPALLLPLWLSYAVPGKAESARPSSLQAGFLVGLIAAAWIGRAHAGGYDNTLLPACLAAALVFGPTLSNALSEASGQSRKMAVATFAGIAQFALLAYNPVDQLPTDRDRHAGERVVRELESLDGDVFAPFHGYLAERAGKPGSAHAMGVIDLLHGSDPAEAEHFVALLDEALTQKKWTAVVLADRWERDLPSLARNYPVVQALFDDDPPELFYPVTGAPWRPERIYRPR